MSSRSDSNQITRDYFDSILLETRYWDSDLPSTKMELYGETFETPIMTAALSHLHEICDNAMAEFGKGAKDAGAVHWVGMGEDDELEQILATGARTVKIIKPHREDEVIYHKIRHAADMGHSLSGWILTTALPEMENMMWYVVCRCMQRQLLIWKIM